MKKLPSDQRPWTEAEKKLHDEDVKKIVANHNITRRFVQDKFGQDSKPLLYDKG